MGDQWAKRAAMNTLYYGDNLTVLRQHVRDETVDLVYLDPPFNSKAAYNVLFAEKNGSRSHAQIRAFDDTWHWDLSAAEACESVVEQGGKAADAMVAFRKLLGGNDMMAYLAMMAPRLIELRRVLKPTGSLYLHCDPTASHYLRVLMDGVFGPKYFLNEVIWQRTSAHANVLQKYAVVHDTILVYSKAEAWTWNQQYLPYENQYIETFFDQVDEDGRRYARRDLTAAMSRASSGQLYEWRGIRPPPSRCWAMTQDKMDDLEARGRIHWPAKTGGMPRLKLYPEDLPGTPAKDIWTDIRTMHNLSSERLGYPTQKPEALLERIIQASSNEGDLVLDPFCGCGTTVAVAQRLKRRWIGIDVTHLAITLMKQRLQDQFGAAATYQVIGEPTTLSGAQALAESDKYQFQWWALGLVGARPQEEKKGADKGIDGRLFFHDEAVGGKSKEIILSVKGGHVTVKDVRDLGHVVNREDAVIGVLITMKQPTDPMKREAASAGFYVAPGSAARFPRIQILTVGDLLAKKGVQRPYATQPTATFKTAPKAKKPKPKQRAMEYGEGESGD